MTFIGADPQELHDIAVRLRWHLRELESVLSAVDEQVGRAAFAGLDLGSDWGAARRAEVAAVNEGGERWADRMVRRAEDQPKGLDDLGSRAGRGPAAPAPVSGAGVPGQRAKATEPSTGRSGSVASPGSGEGQIAA